MRHIAPILAFPDCMRRQALATTRHYSAHNADENPAQPCPMLSRESEAQEPRGNAVPEIGRGKTLSNARICGTRGNVKRRKGVNPYASAEMLALRTCWYSWTVHLSGSIECPVSISVFDISILPSTCTRLDPVIYIRTRGSRLNSPGDAWRWISPAVAPAARTSTIFSGSKYLPMGIAANSAESLMKFPDSSQSPKLSANSSTLLPSGSA